MAAEFIYLDFAASTPVDERVAERMRKSRADAYANPSSNHAAGRRSRDAIETAGVQLGALLNADPKTLIWTSGATESDNLAIAGAARYRAHRGKHLITMPTEHKAVTDVFEMLAKKGFEVSWAEPGPDGVLLRGGRGASERRAGLPGAHRLLLLVALAGGVGADLPPLVPHRHRPHGAHRHQRLLHSGRRGGACGGPPPPSPGGGNDPKVS